MPSVSHSIIVIYFRNHIVPMVNRHSVSSWNKNNVQDGTNFKFKRGLKINDHR